MIVSAMTTTSNTIVRNVRITQTIVEDRKFFTLWGALDFRLKLYRYVYENRTFTPSSLPFCWHQLIANCRANSRFDAGFEHLEKTRSSISSSSNLCGCKMCGTDPGKQTIHEPLSSTLTISRSSVTSWCTPETEIDALVIRKDPVCAHRHPYYYVTFSKYARLRRSLLAKNHVVMRICGR